MLFDLIHAPVSHLSNVALLLGERFTRVPSVINRNRRYFQVALAVSYTIKTNAVILYEYYADVFCEITLFISSWNCRQNISDNNIIWGYQPEMPTLMGARHTQCTLMLCLD